VARVDDRLLKDIGFFNFRDKASDRGRQLATLEVYASDMEVARERVYMSVECVGGDDVG